MIWEHKSAKKKKNAGIFLKVVAQDLRKNRKYIQTAHDSASDESHHRARVAGDCLYNSAVCCGRYQVVVRER